MATRKLKYRNSKNEIEKSDVQFDSFARFSFFDFRSSQPNEASQIPHQRYPPSGYSVGGKLYG